MHVVVASLSLSLSLFITYYCFLEQIYVALGRKARGVLGWVKRNEEKTSRRLLRLGRVPRVSGQVKQGEGKAWGKGATRYLMQQGVLC